MVVNKTQFTTEDRVIELISWMLNIPSAAINPYTDLIDDLYLDTMDRDLLIAQLENRFGVILSPEEVKSIDTVRDASQFIQQHAA